MDATVTLALDLSTVTDREPRTARGTYGLALGTVAVGTSGHSIAGLLPVMSAELHTAPAMIGQLVTAFALVCGVAAPVVSVATARWERRRLLVAALLVTGLGNALAATAATYPALVVGRVVTALGAATATALAVGIAAAAHAPDRRGRAMAVVLSGLAVALLIGVPGAALLGELLGYQGALWVITGLCVVAAATVATTAPTAPAPPVTTLRAKFAAAGQSGVRRVLAGGLLAWISTGTVYPYVALVAANSAAPVSLLLAAYGAGALVGTLAGGRWIDAVGPRVPLLAATGGCVLALLVVVPALGNPVVGAAGLAVWGAAAWSITPALNAELIQLGDDPQRSALLLALAGSVIYLGMGLGAILGGLVVTQAGPAPVPYVAAGISLGAWALFTAGAVRRLWGVR